MLTSVTYKGGGKKEFEYEPNRLTSGEIIGGVRIKEIREYASATAPVSVTRYEYLEGEAYDTDIYYTSVDTESSYLANTFTYRINSMSFNALFDQNGSPIVYPPVKETLPDGSYTLYRYSSFAQYSDSLPEIYTPYAVGMMHESPSYSSRTYLPRTSYAWQRGLLLEQSLYSADGTLQVSYNHRSEAASTTFLGASGLPTGYRLMAGVNGALSLYNGPNKTGSVIARSCGPLFQPTQR